MGTMEIRMAEFLSLSIAVLVQGREYVECPTAPWHKHVSVGPADLTQSLDSTVVRRDSWHGANCQAQGLRASRAAAPCNVGCYQNTMPTGLFLATRTHESSFLCCSLILRTVHSLCT